MNSEEFRETLLRTTDKGPQRRRMTANNVWGKEGAKTGTEGPQDQRSEAGNPPF